MKNLAKAFRTNATDAETKLWQQLRAHRMAGYKFKRQVVIEPYIVDFVCIQEKLIIEADGGQHSESERDKLRDEFLQKCGYRVLRFWNHEILNEIDAVLEKIHNELTKPRSQ